MTDPEGAPPAPNDDEVRVVRRRRPERTRARRARPFPLVPVLTVLVVVAVAAAFYGASRAVGLRPTLGDGPAVGSGVEPLPSAGCAASADPVPTTPATDAATTATPPPGEPPAELEGSVGAPVPQATTVAVPSPDGERTYRWVSGVGDAPGEPAGLVLAVPDAGQDAATFASSTGFELVASTLGYGVATIEPVPPETSLNAGQEVGRPDDILHAVTVVEDVAATQCVDLRRVHVVGHGVGGRLAGALACVRPEYLASVVSVGGGFLADPCPLDPAVSLGLVWSEDDPVAPFAGPDGAEALLGRWAERLGTSNAVVVPVPGADVPAGAAWDRRLDGRQGSTAELLRYVGGGHAWPGWANQMLVEFLDGHARTT